MNHFLDLERLRASLLSKGMADHTVMAILQKAEKEIQDAISERMNEALEQGVRAGLEKDSAEFINELRPSSYAFRLETESSRTEFSDPPYPNLDNLLRSAKPIKDGSGVYKVIPVGAQGKKTIRGNIFDAQKAIMAQRYEDSLKQYKAIAPSGSKVNFRTATSKQDRNTQWVIPAKDKDFTEDLKVINDNLGESIKDTIENIIRSYEDML